MYYVYALRLEGEDNPFYIGKGCGDRPRQHLLEASSWDGSSRFRIMPNGDRYWYNVDKLTKIKSNPDVVRVGIIWTGSSERKALLVERLLIATFGPSFVGGCLTNMTWGGEGVSMTEDIRNKISSGRKGKKHTQEFKDNHSRMFSGENNPFFGKRHTEETKAMVSASRSGKGCGESNAMARKEVRDKISGSNNPNYNISPWMQSRANKSLWKSAHILYESWIVDRCGYVKLAKRNGIDKPHSIITIVENFKSGWVPFEDEEWVQWKT